MFKIKMNIFSQKNLMKATLACFYTLLCLGIFSFNWVEAQFFEGSAQGITITTETVPPTIIASTEVDVVDGESHAAAPAPLNGMGVTIQQITAKTNGNLTTRTATASTTLKGVTVKVNNQVIFNADKIDVNVAVGCQTPNPTSSLTLTNASFISGNNEFRFLPTNPNGQNYRFTNNAFEITLTLGQTTGNNSQSGFIGAVHLDILLSSGAAYAIDMGVIDVSFTGSCSGIEGPPEFISLIKDAIPVSKTKDRKHITYQFVIENLADFDISNLTLTDTFIPASSSLPVCQCDDNSLSPGQSTTCTCKYKITRADRKRGQIINTAVVSGTRPSGSTVSSPPFTLTVALPVLRPQNARGFRIRDEGQVSNLLKWQTPATGALPVVYQIYRNSLTQLVGEVPSTEPLRFKDTNIKRGKKYTYYIVAVDAVGKNSRPAVVVIHPLRKFISSDSSSESSDD